MRLLPFPFIRWAALGSSKLFLWQHGQCMCEARHLRCTVRSVRGLASLCKDEAWALPALLPGVHSVLVGRT